MKNTMIPCLFTKTETEQLNEEKERIQQQQEEKLNPYPALVLAGQHIPEWHI
jgi:hypothetical protein